MASAPNISIPGYSPLTGLFQSAAGSFTWDGASYLVPSGTAFGITGPVALTPAVTADGVKTALRNSPTVLTATAAAWLVGQGMEWDGSQWTVVGEVTFPGQPYPYPTYSHPTEATAMCVQSHTAYTSGLYSCYDPMGSGWANSGVSGCPVVSCTGSCDGMDPTDYMTYWRPKSPFPGGCLLPVSGQRPADQSDWDALPDPLPAVGAELPYAPYLPAGVAAQNNFTITDLDTGAVSTCTNGGCY